MAEQKHFNYEGQGAIKVKTRQEVEVTGVEFLTPARVKVNVDGVERSVMVSVDIINRKVYDEKGESPFGDKVFEYLDSVNSLPEDFFAAPAEVHETAFKTQAEHQQLQEEMIGEIDG